jgi:hypothetical protein
MNDKSLGVLIIDCVLDFGYQACNPMVGNQGRFGCGSGFDSTTNLAWESLAAALQGLVVASCPSIELSARGSTYTCRCGQAGGGRNYLCKSMAFRS